MGEFVQLTANGALLGFMYAILAMGFVLVFKGSGVINFSQGELVLLGAYVVSWVLATLGVPFWLGIPLAALVCAVAGVLIERFALRRLLNESMLALIMATIALGSIIRGLMSLIFGDRTRSMAEILPTRTYEVLGLRFSALMVCAAVIGLLLLGALAWFFSKTKLGLAMQAVADDRVAAQSLGMSLGVVNATAWAIAGAVAALAGFVWGSFLGVDGRLIALGALIFPVVILGGLESIPGAVIGGIVVGIVESLSAGYLDDVLGGGFSTVAPLLLLLVVLLVRPYGLFGRPEIERV